MECLEHSHSYLYIKSYLRLETNIGCAFMFCEHKDIINYLVHILLLSVFMPQTSEKLRKHIALGLSVRLSSNLPVRKAFGSWET